MSNKLNFLDKIEHFGDPWHGLYRLGLTELPNGSTRVPVTAPSGGECFEIRVPGTPAPTMSAADIAAGRTWLDYGILSGGNHVLYGTALGAMSWIYLADDNTPMRATVSIPSANTTSVVVRPLQGSTPEQTIADIALVRAITTTPEELVIHTLMDISPDGRSVIIEHGYNTPAAIGYPAAISRLDLSGLPGAVIAARTLIFDYDPNDPILGGLEVTDDSVTMVTYRELIRNTDTSDEYERVFGPMTDDAWAAGGYTPPPPGYVQQWLQFEDLSKSGTIVEKLIIGYVFDAATLRPVRLINQRIDTAVGWTEPHNQPRVEHGAYTTAQWLVVGNFTSAEVGQSYEFNTTLGDWEQLSGGVECHYVRYTNRLYGLLEPVATIYYPPASPTGQAAGSPLTVVQPKATYHPVTYEIQWHAGASGTIAYI